MATCGYLSIKALERLKSYQKISKEVNAKTILDPFVSLKIACKVPAPEWLCEDAAKEEWFLMSVLLLAKNVSVKSGLFCFKNKSSAIPLLFYFENAVPMGLFCAVIVQLCSSGWWMVHRNQKGYSNLFYLETSAKGQCLRVTLVEQFNCIEAHCDELHNRILTRKRIKKAIKRISDKYQYAFYCPCHKGVCYVEKKNTTLICNESHPSYELIDLHDYDEYWSWFKSDDEVLKLLESTEKIKREKHHYRQGKFCVVTIGKSRSTLAIGLFIFILLLVCFLSVSFKGSSNYQNNGPLTNECLVQDSNIGRQASEMGINDLNEIVNALGKGKFSADKWFSLGVQLDISHNDLKTIEMNYPRDAQRCLTECLAKWLQSGKATYTGLVNALRNIGENLVAKNVLSMDPNKDPAKTEL